MGVIQRQSIKNFFTSYIGVLIGFVNVLIVQPRFLTPEELGLIRVLYSFAVLLSTVVPLGLGNIAIRHFPLFRNREKKHYGFFGFLVAGTLIGFIITSVIILAGREFFVSHYIEKSKLFADFFSWVFPLILFLSFITQLNIYCYSLYKSTVPAFINDVVIRIAVIVLISLYFLKLFPLKIFISLYVLIYGIQNLFLLSYIFYEEKPDIKIDFSFFKTINWNPIIRFGIVIWIASIASMGLRELATVILGTRVDLPSVAVYAVAAFIPSLIEVPLNALDKIATFNITTALSENNLKVVNDIYRKSARYMLLIGGLLFLLVNCNITSLLLFLPEKYRGGEPIIFILSFGTLFNMATGLNSQILVYSGKYLYGSLMLIASVILNFFLLYYLIPKFGVTGAAMSTAVSGIIMNLVNSIIIWKHYNLHPIEKNTFVSIMIMLIVFGIDYIIPHFKNPVFDIAVHGSSITIAFVALAYYLKLIPEMNDFFYRTIKKF